MKVRRLVPSDAAAFQALRLAGLLDTPSAFGSSHAEEKDRPASEVAAQLEAHEDQAVFGAFHGTTLGAVVGFRRERPANLAHKGFLWGLYVAPDCRRQGAARALIEEAVNFARGLPGLLKVNLHVNSSNAQAVGLYESLGFQAYAHERDALRIEGRLYDELQMALVLRA